MTPSEEWGRAVAGRKGQRSCGRGEAMGLEPRSGQPRLALPSLFQTHKDAGGRAGSLRKVVTK